MSHTKAILIQETCWTRHIIEKIAFEFLIRKIEGWTTVPKLLCHQGKPFIILAKMGGNKIRCHKQTWFTERLQINHYFSEANDAWWGYKFLIAHKAEGENQ